MKHTPLIFPLLLIVGFSCGSEQHSESDIEFQNKGHELVYNMVQKVGDYNALSAHKDVTYTYTYQTPDGAIDISSEKYIFDGEYSYGAYQTHQRTLSDIAGTIEQGYNGKEFWLKSNGEVIEDEEALSAVKFNRPTNFYWFAMFQKLLDPGIIYEFIAEKELAGFTYDIVKISFDTDQVSDIYQLYINQETQLVDQFLFTVADKGVIDTPLLMKMEYEQVEDIMIPSKRKYKKSNWNAEVSDAPWIHVNWTNIKFNNNLSKESFNKEHQMEIEKTDKNTSLKVVLEEKKSKSEQSPDTTKKRIYKEGIESVKDQKVTQTALQVGDIAPNFELRNATSEKVSLSEYLEKGPVVLTWYRGGWCPYCNITLHYLQEELPNFKANGANLIALTPELPDKSLSTTDKNELEFEVLSDIDNVVAKEYGVVFKLTDDVAKIYEDKFVLSEYNGNEDNELPLAATYIIDQNGVIQYAFLDADYRNRAEPAILTKFLENMTK